MNSGKTIFAQVMDFLPMNDFRKCVKRYHGNYKTQKFSCLDQFLCIAFAQLTYRESLRDIETCLRAVHSKLYHMGFRGSIARSTLADANENRDWRIYADFAMLLIEKARKLYADDPFGVDLNETVYALDSTTIDLCLSLFPWARFRKRKGAVKIHTLLDLRGPIPSFIRVTDGSVHDVNILDELVIRKIISSQRTIRIFCYPHKKEFPIQKNLLSSCRQITWSYLRPNGLVNRLLLKTTLPGKTPEDQIFRSGKTKTSDIFNKQFRSPGNNYNPALQMPLAGRTLFQMDQATPAHKSLLRDKLERCKDSNLDRDFNICVNLNYQKTVKNRAQSLHNVTDFERYYFRENAHFTGTCAT